MARDYKLAPIGPDKLNLHAKNCDFFRLFISLNIYLGAQRNPQSKTKITAENAHLSVLCDSASEYICQ